MAFASTASGANWTEGIARYIYNDGGDSYYMAAVALGTSDAQRAQAPSTFHVLAGRVGAMLEGADR
jgi:hypothetical protein